MTGDRLPLKKMQTYSWSPHLTVQFDGGPHTQGYELSLTKEPDLEKDERRCCAACLQRDEEG